VRVSRCWCGRRVGLSAGLVQRRGACGLYSVGMTITEDMQDAILKVPADVWTPAYDADEQVRDGAWVADITGLLDLSSWPAGMRVIVRKERPHPGAQLRSPTSTGTGSPRSPPTPGKASSRTWNCGTAAGSAARRIRCAKDTGLRNLPSEGVRPQPASVRDRGPGLRAAGLDPAARPGGEARGWEPRRLRLRLFAVAGRLVRGGRRLRLRLAARWRWAGQITTAVIRLQAIPSGCPDTLSGDGRVVSSMTRLSDRAIYGAATSPAGTKPAV